MLDPAINQIIDISPLIQAETPVFPGDQSFERQLALDFSRGDHLTLSSILTTVHIGAHADAPSHYHAQGQSIDVRDLSLYLGRCQVVDVSHVGPRRLLPDDLHLELIEEPRVLFKTLSFQHQKAFQNQFTSLSPALIAALKLKNVRLVGIDTPSVDPADSKALESHQALYDGDFAVLEGIDLDRVEPGTYTLIALPLKLAGLDASPVRAVLIRNN